jgi:hypothetical protein
MPPARAEGPDVPVGMPAPANFGMKAFEYGGKKAATAFGRLGA